MTDTIISEALEGFWPVVDRPEIYHPLRAAFINKLIENGHRQVRPNFINVAVLRMHFINYLQMNQQKLVYLARSAQEEFLEQEHVGTNSSTNDLYNVDFQGGEGRTGKNTNDYKSTNKTLDKTLWLSHQEDLSDNHLITNWFNQVCEAYEGTYQW